MKRGGGLQRDRAQSQRGGQHIKSLDGGVAAGSFLASYTHGANS